MYNINANTLFDMNPEELMEYLADLCEVDVPVSVETAEDMAMAADALGKLGPLYSFLINMELRSNVRKRTLKKENKEAFEDALIKETIFKTYAEQVKMLYNSTSRMLSVHQQINEELRMLKNQI